VIYDCDEQRNVDQTADCSTKKERNKRKILQFQTRGERMATKGDNGSRSRRAMWRESRKTAEVRKLTGFERFRERT